MTRTSTLRSKYNFGRVLGLQDGVQGTRDTAYHTHERATASGRFIFPTIRAFVHCDEGLCNLSEMDFLPGIPKSKVCGRHSTKRTLRHCLVSCFLISIFPCPSGREESRAEHSRFDGSGPPWTTFGRAHWQRHKWIV